jgi:hypothetical protein
MVLVASLAIFALLPVAAEETTVIEIEIAENPTRFVFDEAPLHEDGIAAYGSEFISQGYIYPAGTLNGSNGVLENGDPEFPDLVIGEWTCRGWHIGDGGHTTSGYWAMTTQTYLFFGANGNQTVVTDGYESPEIGVSVARAIIGGTGSYSMVHGEQTQAMMGFTPYNSINLRVTLHIAE